MSGTWWDGASDYERAVLTSLEASLPRSSPRLVRRFDTLERNRIPSVTWLAVLLTWIGAVLVLANYATSPPTAFAGLAVMSCGLLFLVASEYRWSRLRALRARVAAGTEAEEW